MFGIHSGFSRLFYVPVLFTVVMLILGVLAIGFSLKPDLELRTKARIGPVAMREAKHNATTTERLIIFAVGALFTTVGALGSVNTVTWLRRASNVIAHNRPVPMRATFHIKFAYPGTRSTSRKVFASLQPDGQDLGVPPMADIPLMLGMQSRNSYYQPYQDTPAQVYLNRDTTAPIVINVNGEYWCSNPGFKHPVRRV